ncbi:hypothetical protein ScPMuIL_005085 [Solemya velum]
MTEDVKLFLHKVMKSIDGLHAIVITDREGIPLIKVSTENAPELALRHTFLGTYGSAADQASKLGLQKNKSIVCIYQQVQVVQINHAPLLVTMVAGSDANTGVLLDIEKELKSALKDLSEVVT